MSENSKIEWTDHTYNPWVGCTKVSPGCANCYARVSTRARVLRAVGVETWGKGGERSRTKTAREPVKWNKMTAEVRCADCGQEFAPMLWSAMEREPTCTPGCGGKLVARRARVFCASLADWLDDEVPLEWLADLLKLIFATPNLDWLLLTKRPENFVPRLERVVEEIDGDLDLVNRVYEWLGEKGDRFMKPVAPVPPANVWVGTTVENQAMAEERVPVLLGIPAAVRFLSCEPLLGPVSFGLMGDIRDVQFPADFESRPENEKSRFYESMARATFITRMANGIHWVICGGESGPGARPMETAWAESLSDQCRNSGVAFFMKQMGGIRKPFPEIPDHLMIREFPKAEEVQP